MDQGLIVGTTMSVAGASSLDGTVKIGGGYTATTGTGATIADTGALSMNNNLKVEGTASVIQTSTFNGKSTHAAGLDTGAGFGNTGASLTAAGALSLDDLLKVGGTASVVSFSTFVE